MPKTNNFFEKKERKNFIKKIDKSFRKSILAKYYKEF